jgi:hypothetical protein
MFNVKKSKKLSYKYAFLNKYVFKSLLKLSTELALRICEGREFQTVSAAETNARSLTWPRSSQKVVEVEVLCSI